MTGGILAKPLPFRGGVGGGVVGRGATRPDIGTHRRSPHPNPSPEGEGLVRPVRFAGYAAIFDTVDRGGDVIRPGAFAGGPPRPVPLYWQHDPARPVGAVESLREDARGLRVVARVDQPDLARAVAAGRLTGLSFGYRVQAGRPTDSARGGPGRELTRLSLIEVSLVAQPMQPLARVVAVATP